MSMVKRERKITGFAKVFGSGPRGLLVSLILLGIALWARRRVDFLKISDNQAVLNAAFLMLSCITLVLVIWSLRSLPASGRGNNLCTSGAFRYVRHPLYASFLSVFNIGLALYLNSYLFILWAACLHPIWHYIVRDEEMLMVRIFGEDYVAYRKRTGRFFPRLTPKTAFRKAQESDGPREP